jgi:hypothetical protein
MLRWFFVTLFCLVIACCLGFGVYVIYQSPTLPEFLRHHGPYPIDTTLKPAEPEKYTTDMAEREYLTKIKTSLQTNDKKYMRTVLENILQECQYTQSDKQLKLYVAYGYEEIGSPKKAAIIYEGLLKDTNQELVVYDPVAFRPDVPTAARYTVWLHEEATNRLVSLNLL